LQKIILNNLKVVETEDEVYAVLGKKVGIRDALNIKEIKGRDDLKNPSIGAVIEKVDNEIENTIEIINKFFPNLEIELNHGINKEDYVFLCVLVMRVYIDDKKYEINQTKWLQKDRRWRPPGSELR
jgi:hypothetical protein